MQIVQRSWTLSERRGSIGRMEQSRREIPPNGDPLSETLHMLQLTGTLYCRAELTAPWGIGLPAFESCMMFHVVTEGECWLQVDDDEPVLLRQGSLALIPHGTGHVVRSGNDVEATTLFDLPVEQVSSRYEIMRHGGGGGFCHVTCGIVRFDHVAAQHLVSLLPKVVHIDTMNQDEGSWLQSTLRFISREAREMRPGSETMITRLADILVVQAIRSWIESAPRSDQGWLAALRDDRIGNALAAIHRSPELPWTVASLASEVGMSRSGFSARFSEMVGLPAMRYLANWRMATARTRLRDSDDSIATIAHGLGYQSEASFCRAFKREFEVSPGKMRQQPDPRGLPVGSA